MSQVLNTPEILSLVCSYAELSTCTSLMRVNKFYFDAAIPFVWNTLKTPLPLVELIPGVVTEERSDEPNREGFQTVIPPYPEANFTRFDVYASHVHSLEIRSAFYRLTNWDTLISKSRLRPLLPRLSSLSIKQYLHHETEPLMNELMWVQVFLHQSLTSLHFCRVADLQAPLISYPGFFALVEAMSRCCPNIRKLSFPYYISRQEDEEDRELHNLFAQPIGRCVRSLSGLCELEIGLPMFCEELIREIGFLEHLNSLIIRPGIDYVELVLPEHCPVDENAFPALKSLSFSYLDWSCIGTLLKYQPLTRNIVYFCIYSPPHVSPSWDGTGDFFLFKGMPKLCDLTISFNHVMGKLFDLNTEEALNALSQASLRTVRLVGAHFSELSSTRLDALFPAVTELRLPHQRVDLHQLSQFAVIPGLKHLDVAFSGGDKRSNWFSDDNICCPSLETLELSLACMDDEDGDEVDLPDIYATPFIHTTAQHLLQIFPNIKRIIRPNMDKHTYEYQQLCLLNTRIATIRHLRGIRDRIVQRYGQDAADILMQDEGSLARTLEPFM